MQDDETPSSIPNDTDTHTVSGEHLTPEQAQEELAEFTAKVSGGIGAKVTFGDRIVMESDEDNAFHAVMRKREREAREAVAEEFLARREEQAELELGESLEFPYSPMAALITARQHLAEVLKLVDLLEGYVKQVPGGSIELDESVAL